MFIQNNNNNNNNHQKLIQKSKHLQQRPNPTQNN